MATYYVDPAGDDGNPGTLLLPWETPQHAADTCVAGDTCIFLDGTYTIPVNTNTDWNTNHGTAINPITFRADNRRQAILEYSGSGRRWDIEVDHLVFDGLVVDGDNDGGDLVRIDTADGITLQNCTFRNSDGYGIRVLGGCDDGTIQDCIINPADPSVGVNQDGILVWNGNNWTVQGNTVFQSTHVGIQFIGVSTGLIAENLVYAHGSHGIALGSADPNSDIVIRDNIIHGDATWTQEDPRGLDTGIISLGNGHANIEIYRNVIWYCSADGIYIRDDIVGPYDIYNNTIYNTNLDDTGGSFRMYLVSGTPTVNFRNNILFVTKNGARSVRTVNVDETHYNFDDNCHHFDAGVSFSITRDGTGYASWATYQAAGFEANSINDNPDFVNPGANDFHLQAVSPCIDAGADVGLPYRGTAPDMGAYEYATPGSIVYVTVIVTVVTAVQV